MKMNSVETNTNRNGQRILRFSLGTGLVLGMVLASVAISQGNLFIRTGQKLYCVGK